jgi:hypothetical protein
LVKDFVTQHTATEIPGFEVRFTDSDSFGKAVWDNTYLLLSALASVTGERWSAANAGVTIKNIKHFISVPHQARYYTFRRGNDTFGASLYLPH